LPVDFKLYLITDRTQTPMPLPEAVRSALVGGVPAVQLREKDLSVQELLALAVELRGITKAFKARLFINDRVDVAVAVDADGVHLGQMSMPVSAVRKIVGSDMLIGVSTHNLYEAQDAEAGGADFITIGPIFATPKKMRYGAPTGADFIRVVKEHIKIPVFGLGGIKHDTISQVMEAGADGIAMISEIFAAHDIRKASRNTLDALQHT
jgi:thiamine-phosphate pyrophosphorylase